MELICFVEIKGSAGVCQKHVLTKGKQELTRNQMKTGVMQGWRGTCSRNVRLGKIGD